METFFLTLLPTFALFAGAAALINYCKSKPRSGKHQLTGMCHRSGGTACCSCSDLGKVNSK